MLKRVFPIAWLYIKTTYTSRATLIFTLAMPLLFTFVLGQALDAGFGPEEIPNSWPLAVVDQDGSPWSEDLVDRLEDDPSVEVLAADIAGAHGLLDDQVVSAAILIPAGFGAGIETGETVTVPFLQSAEEITDSQILLEAVNAAVADLSGSLQAADLAVRIADRIGLLEGAGDGQVEAYRAEAFAGAEAERIAARPVSTTSEAVTRLNDAPVIANGASQTSPGMLVMYALFFTFGGGASLIVERDEGTLRRLLVMPMGKGTLLIGKLAGIYVGALIQMLVMVLAGQFLFGVSWGQSPAALITMLLAYGLAGTALGLMVAALARTAAQANAAGTISIMALASLGGAWWPIEIVPGWMQSLALALPTGWAMRGFQDIITRGLGLPEVALEAAVLVGFSALFFAIGIWRFKFE
jgi:ABC-2 type transport system permease protein